MTAESRPEELADAAALDAFRREHDLALVELYTAGCPICASMEPVLDGVARALDAEFEDAAVATVNPRDDPVLVDRYDVRSVPALLLFRDGELVASRADGFLGVDAVLAFVRDAGRVSPP